MALRVLSTLFYFFLVFLHKDRADFWLYFWCVAILFAIYLYDVTKTKSTEKNVWIWAVIFRGVFIFYLPVLSDDVYRFIWDGFLTLSGQNPYLYLPTEYSGPMLDGLLEKINSPNYFSLYPPLKQYVFAIGAFLGNGSIFNSVVAIRFILFVGGLLNVFLFFKIAKEHNFSEEKRNKIAALYAFNPFIILETVGNLHFEGLMLSLLLSAYYVYLKRKSILFSGLLFGLAVSLKLIPLILLPMVWYRLGLKRGFKFVGIVAFINVLLFIPFFELDFLLNIFNSLDLYFHHFEFNAGLYYLLRELGFLFVGYNLIAFIGPLLASLSLFFILRKSFSRGEITQTSLFILFIYLLCTTTVHPWYVIMLFGISLFSNYRFPLVWTFMVTVSYYAYATIPVNENLVFVALEYAVVLGVFVWEFRNKQPLFRLG